MSSPQQNGTSSSSSGSNSNSNSSNLLKSLRNDILSKKGKGQTALTLDNVNGTNETSIDKSLEALPRRINNRSQRQSSKSLHYKPSSSKKTPPNLPTSPDRYSFFDPNNNDTSPPLPSPASRLSASSSTSHAHTHRYTSNPRNSSSSSSSSTFARTSTSSTQETRKERSDNSLASETSFYRRDGNGTAAFTNILSNNTATATASTFTCANDSRQRYPPNATILSRRSVSDSIIVTIPKSPRTLLSPSPTMASSALDKTLPINVTAAQGDKPRNSSIDSAITNITTTTTAADKAHKATTETPEEDINKLIQAAGSSEAVIRYLLKEKTSFTSQNTQLWRLVDKQRAMILGLNKDLERSLKEKERYRRKLKDTMASASSNLVPPSAASNDNATRSLQPRSDSQNSHIEPMLSPEIRQAITHHHDELPPSPIDTSLTAYPLTPPVSEPGRKANVVDDHMSDSSFPTIPEEPEHIHDPIHSALASLGGSPSLRPESGDLVRDNDDDMLAPPPPPRVGLPADPPQSKFPSSMTRKGPPAALRLPAEESASASEYSGHHNFSDNDDEDDEATLDHLLHIDEHDSIASDDRDVHSPSMSSSILAIPDRPERLGNPGGLPVSPRPQDQTFTVRGSSLASPAMASRGFTTTTSTPLSPRPPHTPVMPPPNIAHTSAPPPPPDVNSPTPSDAMQDKTGSSVNFAVDDSHRGKDVYRGFVSSEYPDLLLPPTALAQVQARVVSSRLKPSRASLLMPMRLDEDPVFTLALVARSDGRELWRIERDSASLANLDQTLRQSAHFNAKTPERSLFNGHAPAKIDARRVALDSYLSELVDTNFEVPLALELCKYLSSNALSPNVVDTAAANGMEGSETIGLGPGGRPTRNGYLTKRGKNFGGWKARFFVVDGPLLKYYEAPGGAHLGSIKLPKAEIGKQSQQQTSDLDHEDQDRQYRHAFLIMEPKKKDSSAKVRHVLCAESDEERDQWVTTLLTYVDYVSPTAETDDLSATSQSRKTSGQASKKKVYGQGKVLTVPPHPSEDDNLIKSVGYHDTTQGKIPSRGASTNPSGSPHPPKNEKNSTQAGKAISAPKNATLIPDGGAWGNKISAPTTIIPEEKKQRKRSFFGFGSKSRATTDSEASSTSNLMQMSYDNHGPIRPSFGAPLSEAVRYCHPANVDVELPAVVYRCIEYLDAKNAAAEEGIFRLSGSNIVIRQLRERFNTEGDINLIADEQYYDIHAVASLLKLYLRELPTTILTRELHLEFIAVMELDSLQDKVTALNQLVSALPACNASLLRCLASFLINIINHQDVNKMSVRNVGIVFSPTLNIPAPVFALFLQQYEGIFDEEPQVGRNQSDIAV